MFPTATSVIYRNENGEVTGWDSSDYDTREYCDYCGNSHGYGDYCDDDYDLADDDDDV